MSAWLVLPALGLIGAASTTTTGASAWALAGVLTPTISAASEIGIDREMNDVVVDVVVTGTRNLEARRDTPIAVEVIDRQTLEESGAENVAEAIENAPGIQIVRELGRAGIQVDGLDPQYTLVLIDGQRATGRVNGTIDLSRFPTERIERIEIVKGASSALYGADALGGVVNIITRRAKRALEAEARASYGTGGIFDGGATIGAVGERYNIRGTLGLDGARAFQIPSTARPPGDPSTSGPGIAQGHADLRAEYDVSSRHRLIARGDYTYRNTGSRAATPISRNDGTLGFLIYAQTNRSETYSAALTSDLTLEADDPARIQLTLYYSGWREQFLQDLRGVRGDTPTIALEHLAQATAQHDMRMSASHFVSVGSELLVERLESNQRICRPLAPGACSGVEGPTSGRTANDAQRLRASAFLQDEWLLLERPRLLLVPGFRADVDTQFGTHPTPKISLRLDPTESLLLRASFGLGFRAPSFRELYLSFTNPSANYYVSGNPELAPETSRNVSIGLELEPGAAIHISASFFWNALSHLIDFRTVREPASGRAGLFEYANVARAVTRGVESSITVRPFRHLALIAGHTFLDARNLTADAPLVGRARHRVHGRVRVEEPWSEIVLHLEGQWVGRRPFPGQGATPSETPVADAYVDLDGRVTKRFGEWLEIFASIDNVFDAQDAQFLLVRPRTFHAGATGHL